MSARGRGDLPGLWDPLDIPVRTDLRGLLVLLAVMAFLASLGLLDLLVPLARRDLRDLKAFLVHKDLLEQPDLEV